MTTAHGSITERHIAVVRVTDGTLIGQGEAAALPGFGLETQADAVAALRVWAEGGDAPETPAAAGAVAAAGTNLEAARSQLCLAEYLSAQPPRQSVETQAVIGDGTVDETVAAVTAAVASGFKTLKIKVAARSPRSDLKRISAVRSEAGYGFVVRLDANGGWDTKTAVSTLRAMQRFDVDFVEEPTPDPSDFTMIARLTGAQIALDEHAGDPEVLDAISPTAGISAIVVKPAILGGPAHAYSLANIVLGRGIRVIVSSFMDGPVGLEAAIQVAAALPCDEVHGLGTANMFVEGFPATQLPISGAVEVAGVVAGEPSP